MKPKVSERPVLDFDDILDGYFPLNVSIHDLMQRRGLTHARLVLTQVPIMHIPGLALHEPVPLRLSAGRAGMIERMDLGVTLEQEACLLCGTAKWRWLDGTDAGNRFDPNTRLAEPAYLIGQAFDRLTPTLETASFISFREGP